MTGEQLDRLIDQGRIPLQQVLYIATEICRGLEYAHENTLVHGCLNPSMIFDQQQ